MPIVLCRVDDRLVHGQVVIGWGRPLGVELIVLVDDEVAASAWEQDLYRMAVPPEIEIRFATVAEASAQLGRVAGGDRGAACSSPATSRPWPRSTGAEPGGGAPDQSRRDPPSAGPARAAAVSSI